MNCRGKRRLVQTETRGEAAPIYADAHLWKDIPPNGERSSGFVPAKGASIASGRLGGRILFAPCSDSVGHDAFNAFRRRVYVPVTGED